MSIIEKPREEPSRSGTGEKVHTGRNLLIGLVVLLAGLALIFSMAPGSTGSLFGATAAATSGEGEATPGSDAAPLVAATPTKVSVPSIAAESSLVATGLQPDGSLAVPPVDRPMQASWYDQSPTPGEVGPAIVLGHVNGNGQPGIFAELNEVAAGQEVIVDRADGSQAVFRVSHVDNFRKDSFPTDLVYNDTPNSQLRLITCGGEYDAANRSYLSNVIVYADLVDVRS